MTRKSSSLYVKEVQNKIEKEIFKEIKNWVARAEDWEMILDDTVEADQEIPSGRKTLPNHNSSN